MILIIGTYPTNNIYLHRSNTLNPEQITHHHHHSITDAYLSTTGDFVISITNVIKSLNNDIIGAVGVDVSLSPSLP